MHTSGINGHDCIFQNASGAEATNCVTAWSNRFANFKQKD